MMLNSWILAFVLQGAVHSAGYPMTLQECEFTASRVGPEYTQLVCINTQVPSCKIRPGQADNEMATRCRARTPNEEYVPPPPL